LSKEFEMKDLGVAKKILGMEISRDRLYGKLYLS
jgi:ATP-binding cassette subfamily B (MDR/TAP) protein 1